METPRSSFPVRPGLPSRKRGTPILGLLSALPLRRSGAGATQKNRQAF